MTKEWVAKKNRPVDEKYKNFPQVIFDTLNKFIKKYSWAMLEMNGEVYYMLKYFELCEKYNEEYTKYMYDFIPIMLKSKIEMINSHRNISEHDTLLVDLYNELSTICSGYYDYISGKSTYDFALDSDPMYFDGDIIITDPCYLKASMKLADDEFEDRDLSMNVINKCFEDGIGMQRDTIYGDWSCTTFDMNTKQPIGEFCADSGMVCVIKLDDVFAFNPNFNYHTEKTWTTTLIKDFCGNVQFKVKEELYEYEGKQEVDYIVFVEGHGVNKATGEKIDFITSQTEL